MEKAPKPGISGHRKPRTLKWISRHFPGGHIARRIAVNHPFEGKAGALVTISRLISVLAFDDGLFLPTALFLEGLQAASSR